TSAIEKPRRMANLPERGNIPEVPHGVNVGTVRSGTSGCSSVVRTGERSPRGMPGGASATAGDMVRAPPRGPRRRRPCRPCPGPPWAASPAVQRGDVCRLEAFGPLCHLELHALTLLERPEPGAPDRAVVDEDVLTLVGGDEAVSLLAVEPLDLALCHGTSPSLCCYRAAPDTRGKDAWCLLLNRPANAAVDSTANPLKANPTVSRHA